MRIINKFTTMFDYNQFLKLGRSQKQNYVEGVIFKIVN